MKNINVKVPDEILEDLKYIQAYYSMKLGVSVNQRETVIKLIHETSSIIRNTGEIYTNRNWELEKQEENMHKNYEKKLKGGSDEGK